MRIPSSSNPAPTTDTRQPSPPATVLMGRVLVLVALLVGIVLAFSLPMIVSGNVTGRGGFDQYYFHEPTVRGFLERWPQPDLSTYMSATTPGYHLVLALGGRLFGDDLATLRLVALGFSVALFALFGGSIGVLSRPSATPGLARPGLAMREATALVLPFAVSMYVLFPAGWLAPDNAGWLLVLGAVLLALRPRFGLGAAAAGGAVLLALVMVRQSHAWAAGPLLAAAWLGVRGADLTALGTGRITDLFSRLPTRISRTLIVAAASLPAFAAIYYFFQLWHGLTPPHFHNQYPSSHNLAAPAFILSILGVFSCFFAGYLVPHALAIWRSRRWLLPCAAGIGVVLTVIPETFYLHEPRASGLWNVVKAAPLLFGGHTSVVLLMLAPLGAMAGVVWVLPLAPRPRWVMIATLVAYVVAQTINPLAWQRYVEPMLLMMLPIMACLLPPPPPSPATTPMARLIGRVRPFARVLGPLALAGLLGLLTLQAVRSGKPMPSAPQLDASTPVQTVGLSPRAFTKDPSRGFSSSLGEPSARPARLMIR